MAFSKINRRAKIKRRIRKKVSGTAQLPRLTVFRSNKQIYAQLIDDTNGVTLVSASSYKNDAAAKVTKIEQAAIVGAAVGGTMLAAGGGAAIVAGPALILTAGIMAAVAAAEVDCDAYVCPRGWHDTRISRRCDKEATPKCPPGGYKWDWTRRMCIMPSTGSLTPAPSPSA